jgi:hypothetical protein
MLLYSHKSAHEVYILWKWKAINPIVPHYDDPLVVFVACQGNMKWKEWNWKMGIYKLLGKGSKMVDLGCDTLHNNHNVPH